MLDILLENSTTLLIFLATILLVWYVITLPSMRNMPPGPFPLPVLGNFLMLRMPGANFVDVLGSLKKKYGKIFTFKIGSKPLIYINDLKLLQEAFVKRGDVMSSRPRNFHILSKIEEKAGVGVSLSNGLPWKELRRVSLTAMRDFGVGKKSLEEKVLEEVNAVLDIIGQQDGQPVVMKPWLMKATSNVISSVMFGSRFDFDDPKFNLLLQRINEATKVNFLFLPANFFPLVRYFSKSDSEIIRTLEITSAYIKELVADHHDTFDPDNIRDFVDLVLKMRNTPTGRNFNGEEIHASKFFLPCLFFSTSSLLLLVIPAFGSHSEVDLPPLSKS
ncbi:cytochrome P450 2J6 [Elysia marginata]|uniref:Cytochrome P450 2J6 n=1 Tax=Elysia marginata TaxID=1093978 RepID=A0AAV4J9E3_9GAST|nr:cytochrome P450 2J6 [Elysia marginata]